MRFEGVAGPPPLRPGEVHVWLASLDDPIPAGAGRLLSPAELARADRLASPTHSRRYLTRHVLLRRLLAVYTGLAAAGITYTDGPGGKPRLAGDAWSAGWRFNLSDSEDRCLIAISLGIELGVDIQVIKPVDDLAALAGEVLADDELRDLLALPEGRRLARFYLLWVQKEATVKATGEGLARHLRSVSTTAGEWPVAWSTVGDGIACALVTESPVASVRLLRLA